VLLQHNKATSATQSSPTLAPAGPRDIPCSNMPPFALRAAREQQSPADCAPNRTVGGAAGGGGSGVEPDGWMSGEMRHDLPTPEKQG